MIVIPAGKFSMGSDPATDAMAMNCEQPKHPVAIARPFAIGCYPVTFEEYDAFARAAGVALPADNGWGRGQRPVINVSWDDAQAYLQWLTEQAGRSYRLPTEAEWEHAARAGSNTPWYWGDDPLQAKRFAWFLDNSVGKTQPVGARAPNAFGLYDMAGNVYEWVEDWWHQNYTGAPDDGRAWLEEDGGDSGRRVLRGGAWCYPPVLTRSASRFKFNPASRDFFVGFRVVCRPHRL